jgi:hypothetical protein
LARTSAEHIEIKNKNQIDHRSDLNALGAVPVVVVHGVNRVVREAKEDSVHVRIAARKAIERTPVHARAPRALGKRSGFHLALHHWQRTIPHVPGLEEID